MAGNAAAPAARCRNSRRGSFIFEPPSSRHSITSSAATRNAYVFVSERGGPISPIGFHRLIQRVGEAAKMPFPIHPHMLRHACGFKLANENIQHTVRYTEMAPDRFKNFWR